MAVFHRSIVLEISLTFKSISFSLLGISIRNTENCQTKLDLNHYFLFALSLFVETQLKMTDLSTIRFIPFCGKIDEWPIWGERFLAKSGRFGFNSFYESCPSLR
jgi:hypothetical protein